MEGGRTKIQTLFPKPPISPWSRLPYRPYNTASVISSVLCHAFPLWTALFWTHYLHTKHRARHSRCQDTTSCSWVTSGWPMKKGHPDIPQVPFFVLGGTIFSQDTMKIFVAPHHLFFPANSVLAAVARKVELKPPCVGMWKSSAKIIKSPIIYFPSPVPIHYLEDDLNGMLPPLCHLKSSSHLANFLLFGNVSAARSSAFSQGQS